MGRGRQKAKQTKVARKLKYFSPETDYRQLERELKGSPPSYADDGDLEDDGEEYEIPPAIDDDWDHRGGR